MEIKEGQEELYQIIKNNELIPNFDMIRKHNIEAIGRILTIFGKHLAEDEIKSLKNLSGKLDNNDGFNFDVFFQDYYRSKDKIVL